jgi:hypothetical protein
VAENIVVTFVFVVILGGVIPVSAALWRNFRDPWGALQRVELAASSSMATADSHLRRARIRSQLPVMVGFWSLPIYLSPQVVENLVTWNWSGARTPFFDRAPNFVELFAILLAVAAVTLYFLIVYFNVPSILSPKGLRNDPGLFAVRRLLSRGDSVDVIYGRAGDIDESRE